MIHRLRLLRGEPWIRDGHARPILALSDRLRCWECNGFRRCRPLKRLEPLLELLLLVDVAAAAIEDLMAAVWAEGSPPVPAMIWPYELWRRGLTLAVNEADDDVEARFWLKAMWGGGGQPLIVWIGILAGVKKKKNLTQREKEVLLGARKEVG